MEKIRFWGCSLTGWTITAGLSVIARMKIGKGKRLHIYTNNIVWNHRHNKAVLKEIQKKLKYQAYTIVIHS